ncbi:MAG: type IV pilus biogenesis/stability protein PilW, partial [Gammaproteobacteria bacterium]|nr:type IV pilus biogenesis/stability protein PilW [Gammaproteobacteria bacterium]
MRQLLLVACAWMVCGCVTTETGGLPKPAAQEQRLKAQLDLARGYLEQRDIARAKRPLQTALEIDPTSPDANVLMATVYQVEGEDKLAESAFKQAIRHAPRNSMARNNYGTFLFSKGEYDEARKQLLVAIEDTTYSARPQAYENLGLTELKMEMRVEAEQSFQRALMLNSRQARSMLE